MAVTSNIELGGIFESSVGIDWDNTDDCNDGEEG
jgi:hypothetical protein